MTQITQELGQSRYQHVAASTAPAPEDRSTTLDTEYELWEEVLDSLQGENVPIQDVAPSALLTTSRHGSPDQITGLQTSYHEGTNWRILHHPHDPPTGSGFWETSQSDIVNGREEGGSRIPYGWQSTSGLDTPLDGDSEQVEHLFQMYIQDWKVQPVSDAEDLVPEASDLVPDTEDSVPYTEEYFNAERWIALSVE